jgi:hypothetical protein
MVVLKGWNKMKLFTKKDAIDEEKEPTLIPFSVLEKKEKKTKLILNIICIVIIVAISLSILDVYLVTKCNVGPFFAINTKTYNDGGTKVYYGLCYKVIKYHQKQGRRDTTIGFWSLNYNVEPNDISSLDLALNLRNYPTKTIKKYYKQFMRITGTISNIDTKKNTITINYTDPDGKYNLDIICSLASNAKKAQDFTKGSSITTIGTISNININKNKYQVTLSNAFAS